MKGTEKRISYQELINTFKQAICIKCYDNGNESTNHRKWKIALRKRMDEDIFEDDERERIQELTLTID